MCGGSSIRYILDQYTDIKGEDHPTDPLHMLHINAPSLKSYFEHEEYANMSVGPWDEYYKFTTVRNPWKKIVSYYFFYRPDKHFNQYSANDTEYDFNSQFHYGFNEWLNYVMNGRGLPTYDYFCKENQELLLDDVFKIEDINETLPEALIKNTDIKIDNVPRLNPDYGVPHVSTSHMNWKGDYYSLYNNKSIDIIKQVYRSDIEKFSYKFGE